VQGADGGVGLEVGQTEARTIRLYVPRETGPGDFFLGVTVRADDAALAEALVTLHVGNRASSMSAPGPTLTTALSGVAGTEPGGALEVRAQGPLWGDWSIEGFGALVTGDDDSNVLRGLARVGTYALSPSLRLWSPTT